MEKATTNNKNFKLYAADTQQKFKKAIQKEAKNRNDKDIQEFSETDKQIITNIFAKKIGSGELERLPKKSKGVGELNIEYDEAQLSDDKEIRALQFMQIIDEAIASGSEIRVKDKKLQQMGHLAHQAMEIDEQIQSKFFEISEIFLVFDEKNDEVEKYLKDFRKNIEIQKIEFGDSVSRYKKAVEPFQIKTKKELDSYRKYILTCKELKGDVDKLQSKLSKIYNNLNVMAADINNSQDNYSVDKLDKIENVLSSSKALVISVKETVNYAKDVIEDIESTYKFYKKDFNETNERYNGYVSSMSCSQM